MPTLQVIVEQMKIAAAVAPLPSGEEINSRHVACEQLFEAGTPRSGHKDRAPHQTLSSA
jgi:hypothetical protein